MISRLKKSNLILPLLILFVITTVLCPPASGQNSKSTSSKLDSPEQTVSTFVDAMGVIKRHKENNKQEQNIVRKTMDLSAVKGKDFKHISNQLYKVISKIQVDSIDNLPDKNEVKGKSRWVMFPRPKLHQKIWDKLKPYGKYPQGEIILIRNKDNKWKFSKNTLKNIDTLAKSLAPLAPLQFSVNKENESIIKILGPTFERTTLWQWGALFGCIFIALLIGRLIRKSLQWVSKRLMVKRRRVGSTVCDSLASPLSLAILTLGLTVGLLSFIRLKGDAVNIIKGILLLLTMVSAGWFCYNLVDLVEIAMRAIQRKRSDAYANKIASVDHMIIPLVRKTLRIFVVAIFTIMVAGNVFGLNVAGWVAGFGVVGLAISLAAQDSIKNLFGSLIIFFDRPFVVGDWIEFKEYNGYVEEIGLRSTRMRIWPRYQVTIPNMEFITGSITNVARRPLDRRVMQIHLPFDTHPDKIEQAVQILNDIMHEEDIAKPFDFKEYPPHVSCSEMKVDMWCIYLYYYFMQRGDTTWWDFFEHSQLVNMRITRRFNDAGIKFAFPSQTLYLTDDSKRKLDVNIQSGGDDNTKGQLATNY